MKLNLKSLVLGAALAASSLGITGCDEYNRAQPVYQTINGRPISSGESFARLNGSLAVIINVSGTNLLASVNMSGNEYTEHCANAQALINAEISREGQVEFSGKYSGRVFKFDTLRAGGYEIKF